MSTPRTQSHTRGGVALSAALLGCPQTLSPATASDGERAAAAGSACSSHRSRCRLKV
jgi:hypothetical protein